MLEQWAQAVNLYHVNWLNQSCFRGDHRNNPHENKKMSVMLFDGLLRTKKRGPIKLRIAVKREEYLNLNAHFPLLLDSTLLSQEIVILSIEMHLLSNQKLWSSAHCSKVNTVNRPQMRLKMFYCFNKINYFSGLSRFALRVPLIRHKATEVQMSSFSTPFSALHLGTLKPNITKYKLCAEEK